MNGFKMYADGYKKLVMSGKMSQSEAAPEIRVFEFLGDCTQDDFYRLVDSTAFNDIMKNYFRAALKNAELDDTTISRVMNEFRFLLEVKTAKEISEN